MTETNTEMQRSRLVEATKGKNTTGRPPVWLMRQAGRYHSHYRGLRERYSFVEICKNPEVACEAAMGAVEDFDFDAGILFSDILFPLEAMGMGLSFDPGPKLSWHLRSVGDLNRLDGSVARIRERLAFQAEAVRLTRRRLDRSKALIGFIGGPFTLFCFAAEGAAKSHAIWNEASVSDGRFEGFCEFVMQILLDNMLAQVEAGADVMAILDPSAGNLRSEKYRESVVPVLQELVVRFREARPQTPLIYYSKGTSSLHWDTLSRLPIDCLGVDWHCDIVDVIEYYKGRSAVQGNFNPAWMCEEANELEGKLRSWFGRLAELPRKEISGWVCGLGHGVLPATPEKNVRMFMRIQREMFS